MPAVDNKCLTPGCKKPPVAALRGLCMGCYAEAKRMVEGGETSWGALADAGLVEQEASLFRKAFNNRKAGI